MRGGVPGVEWGGVGWGGGEGGRGTRHVKKVVPSCRFKYEK